MMSDRPDVRRSAPAALRNRDAIAQGLRRFAPTTGRALEIASGSGEHVVHFAEALPGLRWSPSDPDAGQRASIAAWTLAEGRENVDPPRMLDVAQPGWSRDWLAVEGPVDLVVTINLLHLISDAAMETALGGIARVMAPGAIFLLYGPFLRDGQTTSDGDAAFHSELRRRDPKIGYKDLSDVVTSLQQHGLQQVAITPMPANNLLLAFRQPARDAASTA